MTLDIMMPFYGDPEQFRAAVASVLAQTDPDWRLTIVDDVYPDTGPGHWAESIGDSRVVYLRNPTNLGVAGNFQRCIDEMTEPYGVIMGCDDIMRPGYVARMAALVKRFPEASYLQPGVEVIGTSGTVYTPLADRVKRMCRVRGQHPAQYSGEGITASLVRGNWTYFPSICWKTDVLKRTGFRPDYEVVLDLALQMEILMGGGRMVVDDDVVFSYRRHDASVSSGGAHDGTRFVEERDYFRELHRSLNALGWRSAARAARLHLTSRLNAASQLPRAIRMRDGRGLVTLSRHVFDS
jgi:glycosyltransferase involved in cell wall biosynthesis